MEERKSFLNGRHQVKLTRNARTVDRGSPPAASSWREAWQSSQLLRRLIVPNPATASPGFSVHERARISVC
jgi:hypothetical protein